jgi:hypothetical protein
MTNFGILQKLIIDIIDYTHIFQFEGHIPISTSEWHSILFPYRTSFVDRTRKQDYNEILEVAIKAFPKYNFSIVEEEGARHYRFWLKYSIKPENQE